MQEWFCKEKCLGRQSRHRMNSNKGRTVLISRLIKSIDELAFYNNNKNKNREDEWRIKKCTRWLTAWLTALTVWWFSLTHFSATTPSSIDKCLFLRSHSSRATGCRIGRRRARNYQGQWTRGRIAASCNFQTGCSLSSGSWTHCRCRCWKSHSNAPI